RLQVASAERADRRLDVTAFGPGSGFARVKLDRAALRVHAGQRALRTAQDLDALEIEQVESRCRHRAEIDVVDINADARLDGRALIRLTDAADERAHRRALARRVLLQPDVRHLRRDLPDVRLSGRLEHVAADGGD